VAERLAAFQVGLSSMELVSQLVNLEVDNITKE
jgi:hypothetical protein